MHTFDCVLYRIIIIDIVGALRIDYITDIIVVLICDINIYNIMRRNMVRQRVDPVLAPDQFSVARPL